MFSDHHLRDVHPSPNVVILIQMIIMAIVMMTKFVICNNTYITRHVFVFPLFPCSLLYLHSFVNLLYSTYSFMSHKMLRRGTRNTLVFLLQIPLVNQGTEVVREVTFLKGESKIDV